MIPASDEPSAGMLAFLHLVNAVRRIHKSPECPGIITGVNGRLKVQEESVCQVAFLSVETNEEEAI